MTCPSDRLILSKLSLRLKSKCAEGHRRKTLPTSANQITSTSGDRLPTQTDSVRAGGSSFAIAIRGPRSNTQEKAHVLAQNGPDFTKKEMTPTTTTRPKRLH